MMQYAERHIQTAEKIISNYDGDVPLHHYLKQFFAAGKKYGSKDRKQISHACYCYYRLGKALQHETTTTRIKAGIFLCDQQPGTWQLVYDNNWIESWNVDLLQRIKLLHEKYPFRMDDVFLFADHLSSDIDKSAFINSHFIQPDLYLRVRPGKYNKINTALSSAGISFTKCGDNCIALPNATKIDQLLQLNKDVVVQDFSSQRIAEFLSTINHQLSTIKVWDCCAASGGKSILAVDVLKNIELTVSDVRSSIIQNLKKRFAEARIKNYRSFVADLTNSKFQIPNSQSLSPNPQSPIPNSQYDLIICDAPCSGSGTWSRTPEQLSFFPEEKISYYANLQKRIAKNVSSAVATNGYLLYITCSVFREENEDVVEYIKANTSLQLQRMELLKGYDKKADTMFAALFKN